MKHPSRMSILTVGMSVGTFFLATYILCVAYGVFVSAQGMHQLLQLIIPGFTWITWQSFSLGLVVVFAYGWYIAGVFVPI